MNVRDDITVNMDYSTSCKLLLILHLCVMQLKIMTTQLGEIIICTNRMHINKENH